MKALVALGFSLFTFFAHAQIANDTANWKITVANDTATYHLKLIPDIDIHGYSVWLKRDTLATYHKMEIDGAGTETGAALYEKIDFKSDPLLPRISFYWGDSPLPYFNISTLKPGKYIMHLTGCGNGGFINIELE